MLFWLMLACTDSKQMNQETEQEEQQDLDQDGFLSSEDCDDSNSTINPSAAEICDGFDNNCDGNIDEDVKTTYYVDVDEDGFGSADISIEACSAPDGFVINGNDCDDGQALSYPGASEECDGIDNNCDGIVDEGSDILLYEDSDSDGFGDPNSYESACTAPESFVNNSTDCNDNNENIHPDQQEICDEVDNNCDGLIDNNTIDGEIWYRDYDADGYGTQDDTQESCSIPAGYVSASGDCDDNNPQTYPFAIESCDGIDNNCNSLTDEGALLQFFEDADGDGFGKLSSFVESCEAPSGYVANAADCDDQSNSIYPGAPEYCNEIDDDCDALTDENDAIDVHTWYADIDGDGYGDEALPYSSCTAPPSYVSTIGDCNDARPNVYPGAVETCTTVYDDNCDGNTNDDGAQGCTNYYLDEDEDGYGIANSMCLCFPQGEYTSLQDSDCDDALPFVNPGQHENCDTSYDDDCDGTTDLIGASNCTYFYHDFDGDGFGTSHKQCTCLPQGVFVAATGDDCNDEDGNINPDATEVCDGIDTDENCDGLADGSDAVGAISYFPDQDEDGFGDPNLPVIQCDPPPGHITDNSDCDDGRDSVHPDASETCLTAFDDDCNGSNNDEASISCLTFYSDVDQDGYGDENLAGRCLCYEEDDYTATIAEDCDDTTEDINPNKREDCLTSFDDDCDGDDNSLNALNCIEFYYDGDGDGYGISNAQCICTTSSPFTASQIGDCDDANAYVNPDYQSCGIMGNIDSSYFRATIDTNRNGTSTFILHSAVGDIDNDGILDFAYGDPYFDSPYVQGGVSAIYSGAALTGNLDFGHSTLDAYALFLGESINQSAGRRQTLIDINNDNSLDWLVGRGGQTMVLLGPVLQQSYTPSDTAYLFSYEIPNVFEGPLDWDQDGNIEILGLQSNNTYIFEAPFVSHDITANLGSASSKKPSVIDDFDSDGIQDIFFSDNTLVLGNSNHDLSQVDWTLSFSQGAKNLADPQYTEEFGDINGDGYLDLVRRDMESESVFNQYTGNYVVDGALHIVYGPILNYTGDIHTEYDARIIETVSNQHFGNSRNTIVLDIDGDQHDDIVFGFWRNGLYIFYGNIEPGEYNINNYDAKLSYSDNDYFLKDMGDIDGDSYDDFMFLGNYDAHDIHFIFGEMN